MKHAELRSIVHNIADSFASGCGLMIGFYELDLFGEAERSQSGVLTADFLIGRVIEGQPSESLAKAVAIYAAALADLCAKAGGTVVELKEAKVQFWSKHSGHRFTVTIEDIAGRRSTTEYGEVPGNRLKVKDPLGRLRRKAAVG